MRSRFWHVQPSASLSDFTLSNFSSRLALETLTDAFLTSRNITATTFSRPPMLPDYLSDVKKIRLTWLFLWIQTNFWKWQCLSYMLQTWCLTICSDTLCIHTIRIPEGQVRERWSWTKWVWKGLWTKLLTIAAANSCYFGYVCHLELFLKIIKIGNKQTKLCYIQLDVFSNFFRP